MQACTAWLQSHQCSTSLEAEVRARLDAVGVQLVPQQQSPFGILIFNEPSDRILTLLQQASRQSERILAVAAGSAKDVPVWRLLDAGATDALAWDDAGVTARQIGSKLARWAEINRLVHCTLSEGVLVGHSAAWLALVRRVIEAASYSTAPILLTGESGTGKELLARLVSKVTHVCNGSTVRRDLVTVDCGTLVPELSGSEFFGHERGAFTGAHVARDGAFSLADGATLLLDEIGEIPLPLQPQILRCIQEGTYKKLGSNVWQKSKFRLVSATNCDLERLVKRRHFRLDLYHRIAGYVFHTPALHKRREDILPLVTHFLYKLLGRPPPELDVHMRDYLVNRDYSGNVRELFQLVQRIAARYSGSGPITAGDLPEEDRPANFAFALAWPNERFKKSISEAVLLGTSLRQITQTTTETAIRAAMESENGNTRRAAMRLGITDRAIQMRRASGQLVLNEGHASDVGPATDIDGPEPARANIHTCFTSARGNFSDRGTSMAQLKGETI
jgi:transcriptional regulator with GAF, ATPase, and Fis domain